MPEDTTTPSDRRFDLLELHGPLSLVEVDRSGRISRANTRWRAIVGNGEGDDLLERVVPADRVLLEAALRQALGNRSPIAIDFRVAPTPVTQTWLRASLIPIAVDGRAATALCACIDVTREREADANAQRLIAALDDARITLDRIIEATDTFPYAVELGPDGTATTLLETPGRGRLIGASDQVLARFTWETAIHPEDAAEYASRLAGLSDGDRYEVEYRVAGVDAVTRWVHDAGFIRRRSDGGMLLDGAMREVTRFRQLQDELESARASAELSANTDMLTSLANRRRFTELLADAIADDDCGLILLDIDRFKQINDRLGHHAGDRVLVEVAERLRAAAPATAQLARIGGEELVAVLPGVTDEADAVAVAETLRRALRETPVPGADGEQIVVTASFGVTVARRGSPAERALRHADDAMYAAKHAGRDRVARFSAIAAADAPPAGLSDAIRLARTLADLAGARSPEPGAHAATVAELAARTAQALGASRTDALRCRLAGWLHDIGKAAVPDAILTKPGPLDEREWRVMRTHPVLGATVVLDVPTLADAAPGVRHHHERYDGTGYPDGLADVAIPFEARVLAVIDAFSAMTVDRPYRAAMTVEAALAELRACSGSQFDPEVVVAFCALIERDQARPLAA